MVNKDEYTTLEDLVRNDVVRKCSHFELDAQPV